MAATFGLGDKIRFWRSGKAEPKPPETRGGALAEAAVSQLFRLKT
jgi:hypothetical protein